MKKRFFLPLLVLCISFLALGTVKASAGTYGALTYRVSGGEVTITDCDTSVTSVEIPAEIDGYPVTSIGSSAFSDCTSLSSITLPESLTSIRDYAFYDCTSLTAVNISDIAAWCKIEFSSTDSNPLYHGKNLYLNGTLVTDLVIPEGITSIRNYAFPYCTSRTITLPEGVTSIGDSAFFCCDMTSVTIPVEMMSIDSYAFGGCYDLETVYYDGDDEEWEDIYIANGNDPLLNARRKRSDEFTGATLRGQVCSYHPGHETVIQLLQDGAEKYSVTIPAKKVIGQITQSFSIPDVAEGSYDLVVSKTGHLTFTIRGVVIGTEDLDLTAHSNEAISTITLLAGDLNGDGSINTKDRTVLNRNLNLKVSSASNALADINGDGLVNSKDRTILKKNLNTSAENDCIIDYQEGSHET